MAVGSFRLPSGGGGSDWQRPSDWLALPSNITSSDQTFVALHAVIEDGDNYCAFLFTTSTGQYQVDWGDGTIDLVNSNVKAEHQYDFATYDTGNTTLSSRGYKQAIITVTPVSGDLLTCNFQQRYTTVPAQNQPYSTGFLDCILSMPNATSSGLTIGGNTVSHRFCERFDIKTIGGCTNLSSLFYLFTNLQSVPLFDTSNVTSMLQMFVFCNSLKSVPLFNTASVTNMSAMFSVCLSLTSVPLFDTSNVTNMSAMFSSCSSLTSVPIFNTASVINISNMFINCSSLKSVPLFNTSSVTNMSQMFYNCPSLQSVPIFNTSSVTNMGNVFVNCNCLNSIPALSTASITTSSGSDFGSFGGSLSLNRCQMVFARTVSFANCQLSRDAIVEIFNNLVDRSATTSATITITGNWGVTALSAADLLIATNKNWVITT